jgi:glycosyltransferase involved in cell wall biosynthesis
VKIILSNYRYFLSGGPEKYLFATQSLLNANGHEVFPFSVKSARNEKCDQQDLFLSPIGDDFAVYAHEYRKTPLIVFKMLARQFYCPEAFFKARSFARFTDADIVYSLQYLNKMSPAVLDGFKSAGVSLVVRISDFGLICPQAHLFDGSVVCERCLGGNFLHAATHRCVKHSFAAGLIKCAALSLQRLLGCQTRIDAFVFPSKFTMGRFIEAGFSKDKLHHVPTFIEASSISPCYEPRGHILYFGRLVVEKGVHHLLKAYRDLPPNKPRLIAIGALGNTPYADALMDEYKDEVEFHAFMEKDELKNYVQRALCVVIPSIWYDNLPNVLLEAYAYGKPVIAPRHGSFLDLVRDGETGLFYEAGNTNDLREKLAWALAHPIEMADMGRTARALVESEFSPELHYKRLMSIFEKVIKAKKK